MMLKPWTVAVDAQIAAYRLTNELCTRDMTSEMASGWQVDRALLTGATSYMWSREVTAAVLEASKSIPLDTELNRWNLKSERSWWYFDAPLPFETLSQRQTTGVRALSFGFIKLAGDVDDDPFGMPVVCWIDSDRTSWLALRA